MSNDSKTTDPRIAAGAKAWDKHMGGRYAPNEVEELSEEVAVILAAADAVDPRKPRTITTTEELDAAIVQCFEQGENLVLLDGWRPWIIWENDQGDIRVSSLPVEDDPASLSLSDISLPATVLYEPEAEATR